MFINFNSGSVFVVTIVQILAGHIPFIEVEDLKLRSTAMYLGHLMTLKEKLEKSETNKKAIGHLKFVQWDSFKQPVIAFFWLFQITYALWQQMDSQKSDLGQPFQGMASKSDFVMKV